jgi:hypothetical protein
MDRFEVWTAEGDTTDLKTFGRHRIPDPSMLQLQERTVVSPKRILLMVAAILYAPRFCVES